MERGSDKHSARMDDALQHETEGLIRSGHDNRADWNSPEPSGEDQPDVDRVPDGTLHGGVPEGMTEDDVEARSELASYLGRLWPATREELIRVATDNEAPDAVVRRLHTLPMGQQFANLQEVWAQLSGGHVEGHRF
jgi:Protein of unknown function (DUF2795)